MWSFNEATVGQAWNEKKLEPSPPGKQIKKEEGKWDGLDPCKQKKRRNEARRKPGQARVWRKLRARPALEIKEKKGALPTRKKKRPLGPGLCKEGGKKVEAEARPRRWYEALGHPNWMVPPLRPNQMDMSWNWCPLHWSWLRITYLVQIKDHAITGNTIISHVDSSLRRPT